MKKLQLLSAGVFALAVAACSGGSGVVSSPVVVPSVGPVQRLEDVVTPTVFLSSTPSPFPGLVPSVEPVYDVGFTGLYASDSSGNPRSSFVVGEPVVVTAGVHIGNTTPPDGWASGVVELVSSLGASAVGQPFDPKGGFEPVTVSGLAPGSYSLVGKMSTETADANPDDNYVSAASFVVNAPVTPTATIAPVTPVPTATITPPTATPAPVNTATPVPSPTPVSTATPTPVPTPVSTATPVPPTPTPLPTATPTPRPTATPVVPTVTPVPTATAAPVDYRAIAQEILANRDTVITSYGQVEPVYKALLQRFEGLTGIRIDARQRAVESCEVFDPEYSAFISNIGECVRPNDSGLAYSKTSTGVHVRSAPLDVVLMGLFREDAILQAIKDNTTAPPSSELQLYLESAGNIGFVIGDQLLKGLGLDLYNVQDTEENRQLMETRAANLRSNSLFHQSLVSFRLQAEHLGYLSVSDPSDKLDLNEAAGMYLDLVGQRDPNGYLEGLMAGVDFKDVGDRIAQTSLTSLVANADPVRSDRYLRNWSNSFILQSEG